MKRSVLFVAGIVGVSLFVGCGGKPKIVKFTVKPVYVKELSSDQLAPALHEQKEMLDAKRHYRMEKAKLKIRKLDYKMAKIWINAAKTRMKRVSLALKLKNKQIPIDLPAGAYEQAREDVQLAKQNLKYRKLLYKFYKKRLKLLKWQQYVHKAQYMEQVVLAMHKTKHRAASKYPKFRFARQSAKLKLKMAALDEQVEKADAQIKELAKEILPVWAPSIRKQPQETQPQPQPQPQGQRQPSPAPDGQTGSATPTK
ncbi:MAG: hypothetical protein J7M25_03765 [Deltaproteobacteria bacterium]|nr:hypothetical protein [Deltaproteobacteria bacterium]